MEAKLHPALYLIPVTVGDEPPETVLPARVFEVVKQLDYFIVENERSARRFLRKAGVMREFQEVKFFILNKHTPPESLASFIHPLKNGAPVGLLSEAGVPCVADPGNEVVKLCHQNGVRIVPLTGPSSILLALMASGFNGQNFAFHGYLPIQLPALKSKLKSFEEAVFKENQTQIFIETPYRNNKLLEIIAANCHPELLLCIAVELTGQNEMVKTKAIKSWKNKLPDLHKKPAVFLLYK
jgi:16S rRNA (cytidine1402-2'-O)-methyltransferase